MTDNSDGFGYDNPMVCVSKGIEDAKEFRRNRVFFFKFEDGTFAYGFHVESFGDIEPYAMVSVSVRKGDDPWEG